MHVNTPPCSPLAYSFKLLQLCVEPAKKFQAQPSAENEAAFEKCITTHLANIDLTPESLDQPVDMEAIDALLSEKKGKKL